MNAASSEAVVDCKNLEGCYILEADKSRLISEVKMMSGDCRRKVLKAVTVGAPVIWAKPVVDSIVLPTHAKTTCTVCVTITIVSGASGAGSANFGFLEFECGDQVFNGVLATDSPNGTEDTFCMTLDVGSYTFQFFNTTGGTIVDVELECCGSRLIERVEGNGTIARRVDFGNGTCAIIDGPFGCISDIRLKTNIKKIDHLGSAYQLYSFEYLGDANKQLYVGVMAQDLLKTHPDAVSTGLDGYYRVNYESLGLKMISLEDWRRDGIDAVNAH